MKDESISNKTNCIFCKIDRGEVTAEKVYEDKDTLAFLDIRPNNVGHTLVVPKEHYENTYSTPDNVLCAVIKTAKKVAVAVKKGTGADGINITNNNDSPAGQLIFHTHFHIVPRFTDDGFKHWPGKEVREDTLKEAAEKIRKSL